ncbi:hypothetical protein LMG27198_24870 [Methylocystis echinoides]|uniref:Uncharacterized protein n=1 Tax=Methylocystis echinoides TaxID=29468 RepID=A0A9W6GV91_9HYPH|nr:hypothetical protein LMG27198_24870 [Methylocystis echinoides]
MHARRQLGGGPLAEFPVRKTADAGAQSQREALRKDEQRHRQQARARRSPRKGAVPQNDVDQMASKPHEMTFAQPPDSG